MNIFKNLHLKTKIVRAQETINKAIADFGHENIAVAWTGGKDSTLLLWLVRESCNQHRLPLPKIVFIDEGDLFPEIVAFTKKLARDWNFSYTTVRNDDVLKQGKKLGMKITVSKLNLENQHEITKLGYDQATFPFEPESFVGNHLMKTAPLNSYIRKSHVKAVLTGIRRDENPARSGETEFSIRQDPNHTRVHPIIDFTEKEVWDAIRSNNIPYVSLYEQGYRSLGAKTTTHKAGTLPAWEQDFAKVKERAGRQQDKEQIMEKLRKLGYM